MVLEKRKSDVLLDKGGTMFKVQAQFSGVMLASSLYAFYMAYLDEDLDELLLPNEKASLDAAYFKFGASHLTYGIVFLPGSTLLFGRFLFRLKKLRQKSSALTSMKNIINQESSKFWILQLLAALSAGLTSFLSLDSKSQKEYLSLYLLLLSIKMESQKAYHFCQVSKNAQKTNGRRKNTTTKSRS